MNGQSVSRTTQALVAAIVTMWSSAAVAGPFGLEMGMNEAQLRGELMKPGYYRITEVPNPNSGFEYYIGKAPPGTGLCWLKAVGKNINTNGYGMDVRSEYEKYKAALTEIYGQPTTVMERLLPRSIWKDPDEFMMSLRQKDRFHAVIWEAEDGATLKDGLRSVGLMLSGLSSSVGFVSIEYSFDNYSGCEAFDRMNSSQGL